MCNYLSNNLQFNLINNSQTSNINDIEQNLYYKKTNYTQTHLLFISILLTIYYYSLIKFIIYFHSFIKIL